MKITRIYTMAALNSLDYKMSFDHLKHKLEYLPHLNMFQIDGTLIPMSNVREVVLATVTLQPSELSLEEMVQVELSLDEIATAKSLPEDKPKRRLRTVKGE